MSPNGDALIIKTQGKCEELAENHATGIILALEMGKTVNNGIKAIQSSLETQSEQIESQGNTLKAINVHLGGIATWQDEHDKRLAAAKAAAVEKRKAWEPIKNTAITTIVRVAVGGTIILAGSILFTGFWVTIKTKLGL